MLKTQELYNVDSCLNHAAADEPLFILRANDPIAPQTDPSLGVTMSAGVHKPEKIAQARKVASEMEDWKRDQNMPKVSDAPSSEYEKQQGRSPV